MKYHNEVSKICGDNWETVNEQERDGGYGVACLIAYMRGVKSTLNELSKHLGVSYDDLATAFYRLDDNGAFNKDCWNAREDDELLGNKTEIEIERAWAFVAACASGFLGYAKI